MSDTDDTAGEFQELNDEAHGIWNANAEWWDDRIGDGNDFQTELIEPASLRLLQLQSGERVVDAACGAGRFARIMAEQGASVDAFDYSEAFIARARERTPEDLTDIRYHVIDGTDSDQVHSLGTGQFNAAASNMALMDMASIEPLFAGIFDLLKPGGRFVFSVTHPCFHSIGVTKVIEQHCTESSKGASHGIRVMRYITPGSAKGEGIRNQPQLQYYFHRPLHLLLAAAFKAGFTVDGLEEPAFPADEAKSGVMGWHCMPEIPPVLVVRVRK
ncbi:MAG: class I SAM-dependent methyltransferase [bacterium]|nr:class I SAM-dependent methyltransferase [bacterium]